MGNDYKIKHPNVYFQTRKDASVYDGRLSSREGAAEVLDMSVASLADYELGRTKNVPPDRVLKMTRLYMAPELRNWYCVNECPLGNGCETVTAEEPISVAVSRMIRTLRSIKDFKLVDRLLTMAISGTEVCESGELDEIVEILGDIAYAVSGIKIVCEKALWRR